MSPDAQTLFLTVNGPVPGHTGAGAVLAVSTFSGSTASARIVARALAAGAATAEARGGFFSN